MVDFTKELKHRVLLRTATGSLRCWMPSVHECYFFQPHRLYRTALTFQSSFSINVIAAQTSTEDIFLRNCCSIKFNREMEKLIKFTSNANHWLTETNIQGSGKANAHDTARDAMARVLANRWPGRQAHSYIAQDGGFLLLVGFGANRLSVAVVALLEF